MAAATPVLITQEQREGPQHHHRGTEQVDRTPADPVGERTPEDRGEDADAGRDHERGQRGRAVGEPLADEVGQHERDRHRVARGLGDAQAEGPQHVAPVVAEHVQERVLGDVALFLELLELRGLLELEPDEDAHDDQDGAQQERHPPRPRTAQRHAGQERQVRQEQPDRETGLRDAGVEAALAPGGVLEAHQDRAAPFGAEREPLHDPHGDEQDRGPDADLRVGGQEADQHGRDPHEQQGADEDRLAADPVTQVAADDAAERTHGEADAERCESEQRARERVARREERVVEVEGRGGTEADEVVGLDRRADRAPDGDLLLGRCSVDRVPLRRLLRDGSQAERAVRSW